MQLGDPEVTVEGLLDLGSQVGVIHGGGQIQFLGQLVHHAGDLVEDCGGGLGDGNTAGDVVTAGRTPVTQTTGEDVVTGDLLSIVHLVLHPLLHLVPMATDDVIVAVVMVHPVGHDHVGTAPQGRCLQASALTGGDHLPYAEGLVGGAEIVDVLLVGCLQIEVHHTVVTSHLSITQPTASLAGGAILGEAVVVGAEGREHDGLEIVQVIAGALKASRLGKIGGHHVANADVQGGINAEGGKVGVARDLHVTEAVIGEARSPGLTLGITAGDVNILLDTLGGEGTDGAVVQRTVGVDGLGKAENDLCTTGGGGDLQLHHTGHVLAEVHDPSAVLYTAAAGDGLSLQAADEADGGHHAELQLAAGHVGLYHRAPLLLVAVVVSEVRCLQTAIVGLACVEVVDGDGTVLVFPILGIGGDDLLLTVLVGDLQLSQEAHVVILETVHTPNAGLGVPAVTQKGRKGVLLFDEGGHVIDAVEDLAVVVGEGGIDEILADLTTVDVVLATAQTADEEPRLLDAALCLELGTQVGRPALDVTLRLDEHAGPLVGGDVGKEVNGGGSALPLVVGGGDRQGIARAGVQSLVHGDVDGLVGSLTHPSGLVTAYLGNGSLVGGLENVGLVGLQLPAHVQILTGGICGILHRIDGKVVKFQHIIISFQK